MRFYPDPRRAKLIDLTASDDRPRVGADIQGVEVWTLCGDRGSIAFIESASHKKLPMPVIDQHAERPDVRPAYKVAVAYVARRGAALTPAQVVIASELKRRIRRLENDCHQLVRINNQLVDAEALQLRFDEASGTVTFSHKDVSQSLTLKRANPDVPVRIRQHVSITTYDAGRDDHPEQPGQVELLKISMEPLLEHYYENGFRITKLVQQLTANTKDHCAEITAVRNDLIVHPKEPATIYSFGFGSNGPVVKPVQWAGPRVWNDTGLVPNTRALVAWLVKALS